MSKAKSHRPTQRRPQGSRPRPRRKLGAVVADVRPLVDRLAHERDVVVWDVEFRREAGREVLTVALDRPDGIDSETLARFAETLSRELDDKDVVPGDARYLLEVTSPGADRKVRTPEQFRVCRSRDVRVTFKDGRPPLEGAIGDVDDQGVWVEPEEGDPVRAGFDQISQARLTVPGV